MQSEYEIIIIIRCQIWNRHWRPCLSKHLCHQTTSKNLNPYFVHLLPSYKDYQEMLFVVCPYRVCLLLYQLKIRIPDNIPIEVFAVLEDIGIDFLTKLLNSIYDSGKIPKDLAKSVFITLPKIPGTMDCELYRTISLMSHLTKVLLRIIMARMRKSLRV